jgi:hypothetical protein
MTTKTATSRNQNLSEFFPMTREELAITSIPHIRLAAPEAPENRGSIPTPHAGNWATSQGYTTAFTVAARSGTASNQADNTHSSAVPVPAPSRSPQSARIESIPVMTSPIGSDVRFVTRSRPGQPTLEEMAREAFSPGESPFIGTSDKSGLATQTREYPYWAVALVQIAIGTLLVILVVKFANLMRESTDFAPQQVLTPAAANSNVSSDHSQVTYLDPSESIHPPTPSRPNGF